jgi:hypothetical protein
MQNPNLPQRGVCTEGGITHVLSGNGGAGFTHNFPRNADGSYLFASWIKYGVQDVNGYVRVTTDGGSTMTVEAVGSDDGRVFDSVKLMRPPPSRANSSAKGGAGSSGGGSDKPTTTQSSSGLVSWLLGLFERPRPG